MFTILPLNVWLSGSMKTGNFKLLEKSRKTVLSRENLTLLHGNIKGANQPAHMHSLISTFVIHSLASIIA